MLKSGLGQTAVGCWDNAPAVQNLKKIMRHDGIASRCNHRMGWWRNKHSHACFLPLPLGIQSVPELQEADVSLPCIVPIAVEKECGCKYIQ